MKILYKYKYTLFLIILFFCVNNNVQFLKLKFSVKSLLLETFYHKALLSYSNFQIK